MPLLFKMREALATFSFALILKVKTLVTFSLALIFKERILDIPKLLRNKKRYLMS